MRRRLTAIYVLLLALVLAGLEVPLAITLAARDTQQMGLDRLSAVVRFATLAEPALRDNDRSVIRAELAAYRNVHGVSAVVVNREGRVVVGTPQLRSLISAEIAPPGVDEGLRRALVGSHVGADPVIWPWQDDPMVITAPVGTGGEVLGAVVTVSPTGQLRRSITSGWLLLAALGLIAVAGCVLAAEALARWTLKPVAELDSAANLITEGDYRARVPGGVGPPELRRLATAFNEMADNVSDALERQRAFVSQASHQMRNPLTALQLRVEGLGEDMASELGRSEHRLAMAETERLSRILDSLLALARAERGRYQMEDVDAVRVAMERVAAWQPLAWQRKITLRYAASHVPVWVEALSTALDQTLDALIDNALKFSGLGGRVDVSVHIDASGVVVHVADTGPGLTQEQRRKAIDRFWRAPAAQNVAGSGLGLPIVAVLVEASGGALDLFPVRPHGLDVRLTLRPAGGRGASLAADPAEVRST